MSITLNSRPFDVHSTTVDGVVLKDYTNDATSQALLSFKRTAPKRVKEFPGMKRSEVKYSVTALNGDILGILTISSSIRADVDAAVVTDLLAVGNAAYEHAAHSNLVNDQRLPLTA